MKKNYLSLQLFAIVLSLTSLTMSAQLNGNYTIDQTQLTAGTNFASFNALASALTTSGITGPVNVSVLNGPYNEQVTFPQITGAGANARIVINGNGNRLTFNGTSGQPWTMRLNGCDYLTVNNLQMEGTNGTYAFVCLLTNAANYNMFSFCTFSCQTNITSSYAVPFMWSSSSTGMSTGANSGDNNTVSDCQMFSGYYGIVMYGLTGAPYQVNNTIQRCQVQDWYYYGIYTYYQWYLKLLNNVIERPTRTNLYYAFAIYQNYSEASIIDGNIIQKLWEMAPTQASYYAYCMYLYNYILPAPNVGKNICRNNIIRNIRSNYYFYGIMAYYDNVVYHNTISFDNAASTQANTIYGIYAVNQAGQEGEVKNNIVSMTMGGSGPKYGIYNSSPAFTSMNGNNVWSQGGGSNYYIGYHNGVHTTNTSWIAAGADASGSNFNPNFVNILTDSHPTNTSLNNTGVPIGVLFDQEMAVRHATTPDRGALEFLTPVCSGTPSMTIAGPNYSICPGESVIFNIGNLSSDLGYTYQWQWGNTSSVGPFTVIPGANTIQYQSGPITGTAWYSAIITCTAPGGGTITPVAQVNVSGLTTSVVPYYESFENIGLPNRLPNCSWSVPSLGSGAKTYVAAAPGNLLPNTGNAFAAFSNSGNGSNYYYTNGIYLNAGITYSASMWYMTDFTGATNWSNLSIMLNNTQTSTGLTTIASVAPAVSPFYKSLSNIFTVPSSGMYYVAIKGTVSGAGANNLVWDDLRIDIPCTPALNTPVMNLSANTTTICSGDPAGVILTASGADTYTWSTGGNGNAITDYPTITTLYNVIGTNSLTGCMANLSQLVNVKPSPNISLFALPPTVCAGKTSNLQASGANSYTWTAGGSGSNVNVIPTAPSSTYAVMGSGANGCVGNAMISVAVNNLPNVVANPSNLQPCQADLLTLSGNGATTYQWVSTNPAMVFSGQTAQVNVPYSTTFTLTGTDNNGCSNTSIFSIEVIACTGLTNISATGDLRIFPNPSSGEFNVILNNVGGSVEVTDLTGRVIYTGSTSGTEMKIDLSGYAAGVYHATVRTGDTITALKIVKE